MTPRAKTILAVLVAITLAGVGYFFIINKSASLVLPPVNTVLPKTEEIDTSDWQTYRNEKLGFEIKMPKEWVKSGEDIGPQPFLEDEFWQEQVGGARFIASMTNGFPQFNLRVKDSDLTLERFAGKVGFGKEENFLINNLPAVRYFLDGRKDKQPNYREALLLKNNSRYHYFEFSASDNNIDNDMVVWNKIISAFKPLD